MPLQRLNFGVSRMHPIPTVSSLTKCRMVQSLCKGIALFFEILVLVLLLFLRFIELASTRCLSVVAQSTNPPKAQCPGNPPPQARRRGYRPLAENHDLHEPQQSHLDTPASRMSLMRSSSSLLLETSITQHREPAPSSKSVKEHNILGGDSVDEWDIRSITDDSYSVTPSRRSVLDRRSEITESTSSSIAGTIPTRPPSMVQVVHKLLHHGSEADLREPTSTRREANASNPFSTISISHKSIELQPSVVEPSLLQNPLSPPRTVAHIESPHRPRPTEHPTRNNSLPALRSNEDGSPKLTDSLSYLRTLAKAKKGTASFASTISRRYQSHRKASGTIPSERASNMET